MVAVISVDAYPFSGYCLFFLDPYPYGFLRPDLSPWECRNRCFLVALCCLVVRRPNLEVATMRLFHHQVKIPDSFSAKSIMEVYHYCYFQWRGYFEGPWVSFVSTDEFSERVTKLLQGLVPHELTTYLFISNLFLTQWIMVILLNGCKPDNFEPYNSLKLRVRNI